MDDSSYPFRQKPSNAVPRGQEQQAVDADPSEQSGTNARIGTPVWQKFVTNTVAQENNRAAVAAENDQIRQASINNRRSSERQAVEAAPIFKGANGRLIRKIGRQTDELDPNEWADDPIAGPEARKSLWDREIRTAKSESDNAGFALRDPAFHAKSLSDKDREAKLAEGSLLQESDPRHQQLKSELAADDEYRKTKAELSQKSYDSEKRAREIEAMDPESWWQTRQQPAASEQRAGAVQSANAQHQEADAAEQSAIREATDLRSRMAQGLTGAQMQEAKTRLAEIGQAQAKIAESKQQAVQQVAQVQQQAADELVRKSQKPLTQDPRRKLVAETFKMMTDGGRSTPGALKMQGDTQGTTFGRGLEKFSDAAGLVIGSLVDSATGNPDDPTWRKNQIEKGSLDLALQSDDLVATYEKAMAEAAGQDKNSRKWDDKKRASVMGAMIEHFRANGITDGKEMTAIMRDAAKENVWAKGNSDHVRTLSDGHLVFSPILAAGKDPAPILAAIDAASVSPEEKASAKESLAIYRSEMAKQLSEQLLAKKESGYTEHVAAMKAQGITDPDKILYSWDGLSPGFFKKNWDTIADIGGEAWRGISGTIHSGSSGAFQALGKASGAMGAEGMQTWFEGLSTDSVDRGAVDQAASEYAQALGAARGERGSIRGSVVDMGSSVGQMAPMFAAGGAGRLIGSGAEAGGMGKFVAQAGVYGWAGLQGYGSMMDSAIQAAKQKANSEGREFTDVDKVQAINSAQGPAIMNAIQTGMLSKMLGEGTQRAALGQASKESAKISIRDGLTQMMKRTKETSLRAALVELKPEIRAMLKVAKSDFKDEFVEEGLNQAIEGIITKATVDPTKDMGEVVQESVIAAFQGGLIGVGVPAAGSLMTSSNKLAPGGVGSMAAAAAAAAPENDPELINTAIAAIDPQAAPASPEEMGKAALLRRPGDGAKERAEGILIERELAQIEQEDGESITAADQAVADATATGDKAAIQDAEAARVSLPTGRADTTRAVLKIAAGQQLDDLTSAELAGIGMEETKTGFKPVKGAAVMVRTGSDGSIILTDAALKAVEAVSPRARARVKMSEAEAIQKAKARAAQPVSTSSNGAQGDPATGSSASSGGVPSETKGAMEFDVPMRDGSMLRVQARDATAALEEAAAQAPITGQSARAVVVNETPIGEQQPSLSQPREPQGKTGTIEEDPSTPNLGENGSNLGQTSSPSGLTEPSNQPAPKEKTPADKDNSKGEALAKANSTFAKAKKKLGDRLTRGNERAVTRPDRITINPEQIIEQAIARGMDEEQASEYFSRVLDEEIRHLAQYDAAKLLFNSAGKPGGQENFAAWMSGHYAGIWQTDFVATGKADTIRDIYARTETGFSAAWDSMSDADKAMEAIRMMSQGEAITEQGKLWANISETLQKALRAALAALKQFKDVASPTLKSEIQNLENALRALTDSQPRTGSPKADPAKPAESGKSAGNGRSAETAGPREASSDGRPEQAPSDQAVSPLAVGARVEFERDGERLTGRVTYEAEKAVRVDLDTPTSDGLPKVMVFRDEPSLRVIPALKGEKINQEWTAFSPESGTLGIPRALMPQIKAGDRSALVQFLKARGVNYREETVPASSLKPTQTEYSPGKVEKAKAFEGGNRSILISSDNHVLDGHHQWMAALEKGEDIATIRLDAPIRKLLPMALQMPSVTTAGGEILEAPESNPNDFASESSSPAPKADADQTPTPSINGSQEERQAVPEAQGQGDVLSDAPGVKAPGADFSEGDVRDARVRSAKEEIEAAIKSGDIPSSVRSFSELNDYVDANEYVNDAEREDRLIGTLGKRLGWKAQDYTNFTNSIIGELDSWLASRQTQELSEGDKKALDVIQGLFAAELPETRDADYLAAVEAGDIKSAQTMVDSAAESAGYNKVVTHQTHKTGIEVLDRNKGGVGVWEWDNIGIWTTTRGAPRIYGPVNMDLYGKMENPKRYRNLDAYEEMVREYLKVAYPEVLFALDSDTIEGDSDTFISEFRKAIKAMAKKAKVGESAYDPKYQKWLKTKFPGAEGFRSYLKKQGHDGIQIDGAYWDGQVQTVRIFLEPEQLKSSDPVTRDADGNVIPLSQRFNPASDSILYAAELPETFTRAIPPDRFMKLMDAANTWFSEGVTTPEKLANKLEGLAPERKAVVFSQPFWFALKAVGAEGVAEPDWAGIYASRNQDAKDEGQPVRTDAGAGNAGVGVGEVAVEAAPAVDKESLTTRPAAKRAPRKIDTPVRREAFIILNSAGYETISVLSDVKITRPPKQIPLILARRNKAAKLTAKEVRALDLNPQWNDMPTKAEIEAWGPKGKVAAEIHGIVMSDTGGEDPNVAAGYLGQGTSTNTMWEQYKAELKAIAMGLDADSNPLNANREWSDAEIAAEEKKAATPSQSAAFDSANDFDFGRDEVEVANLKVGDIVTIDGEKMTVESVDAEGNVVLQDGSKFGRQFLDSGESIWVESEDSPLQAEEDLEPTAEWLVDRSQEKGYVSVDEFAATEREEFDRLAQEQIEAAQRDAAGKASGRVPEGGSQAQGEDFSGFEDIVADGRAAGERDGKRVGFGMTRQRTQGPGQENSLTRRAWQSGYDQTYQAAFDASFKDQQALNRASTPAGEREASERAATKALPISKMDIRNADSKELFADDGGFKLGQDSTVDGDKVVADRKAKEDAKAAQDAAQGDIFAQASTPPADAPIIAKLKKELARMKQYEGGLNPDRVIMAIKEAAWSMMGDSNAEKRQDAMEFLTGDRPAKAKAGVTNIADALKKWLDANPLAEAQVPTDNAARGQYDERLARFKESGNHANSLLADSVRQARYLDLSPEQAYQDLLGAGVNANKAAFAVETIHRNWERPAAEAETPAEKAPPVVEPPNDIESRISQAEVSGVVLSDADKVKIREAYTKAERLNKLAGRLSVAASDPLNKGNAFPMGVGFTRETKRSNQRIDASVKKAGQSVILSNQAKAAEAQLEGLLAGKGTDADAASKATKREASQRQMVDKILAWKKGDKFTEWTIEKVNNDRDGYPASFNFSGDGIIKGVDDKIDIVKTLFDGDSKLFRKMVDEARSGSQAQEKAPSVVKGEKAPSVAITTLDSLMALSKRIREGEITADEVKAAWESYKENEIQIQKEVMKMTMKELERFQGIRKPDNKADAVRMAMDYFESTFNPGNMLSYGGIAGRADMNKAKRAAMDKAASEWTDEIIQAQAQERRDAISAREKALNNPETLDEWKQFVRRKGLTGMTAEEVKAFNAIRSPYDLEPKIMARGEKRLTPEQLAAYDEVRGVDRKAEAQARKEREATVRGVKADTDSEIVETKHTKTGADLFVVRLADRVERDVYNSLNAAAKRLGGGYSSYSRDGAVPGFQFKNRAAAEQFQAITKGETVDRAEAIQERQAEKKSAAAERLTALADRMDSAADKILSVDRKTNTAKRAREAGYAESNANSVKAMATTMRNLAEAIESGEATHLDGVRTRTHVETLYRLSERAKTDSENTEGLTYSEREKRKGQSPTPDQIAQAKYPYPFLNETAWKWLIENGKSAPGAMRLTARLEKVFAAKPSAQANGSYITGAEMIGVVKELLGKIGRKDYTRTNIESAFENYDRVQAMGLADLPMLRAALREFLQYRGTKSKADPIKVMERELAGMKIPGFFPTPPAVVERMLEEAGDLTGKHVLEPSAGKGDIADAAKAAGAVVDVIEQQSRLRSILAARGYRVMGEDFTATDPETRGFTYGDVFQNKDNAKGILRGQGGMGSERVRLVREDGSEIGKYNFSELEGVEKRGARSGYDVVLMNPPFEDGQDAEHVRRAFDFLKPGGKLVAIMGEGVFGRSDKKSQAFRDWLDSVDGTSEKLPEGSFKSAFRPTGVNTRLVVVEKAGMSLRASELPDAPLRQFLNSAFNLPPSSYEFEPADENRSKVLEILEKHGLRPVNPKDYRASTRDVQALSGTAITYFQGGDPRDTGFVAGNLIFINAERDDIPTGWTIAHELVHVAQKDKRTDAKAINRLIKKHLSVAEIAGLEDALLEDGKYSPEALPTELPAFLVADAVMGTEVVGFESFKNGEALKSALIEWFDAMPSLEPEGLKESPDGLLAADLPETNADMFKKRVPVSKALTDEARRQQEAFGKNVSSGELAGFGDKRSRDEQDIVDAVYEFERVVKSNADAMEVAKKRLAADPADIEAKLLDAATDKDFALDTADHLAIQLLINQRSAEAGNDLSKHADNMALRMAYRLMRGDVARVLQVGYDRSMSPAERALASITDAIYTPSKKVEKLAMGKPLSQRKAFFREAAEARVKQVEAELRKMGVTLGEIMGQNERLKLAKSDLMKQVAKLRKTLDQDILKMVQNGASIADIKRRFGKEAAETAQEVNTKAREELRAKIAPMIAAGMTMEQIVAKMGALAAADLPGSKMLTPEQIEAEIERVLSVGFGLPKVIPATTVLIRPRKPKVIAPVDTNPLTSDWSRPVFTDGLNSYEFDTKDRSGIMSRVESIRSLAGAMGKINTLTDEKLAKATALIDEINGILAKYGTDASGIFAAGKPIEDYRFNIDDINHVSAVARAISAIDADWIDKASEVLYANMLSGLQTMAVNATAILPAAWESTVGRGVEMAINLAVRDPMAAQIGEEKYILKALAPAITRAMSNFSASFTAQHPMFDRDVLNQEVDWDKILGGSGYRTGGSISGKKGDIIRIPIRILAATDDFNRTLMACVEVGTFAYRIAKAKGMKPGTPEFDRFLKVQVNTPGSIPYRLAAQKASRANFSNALPGQKDNTTGEKVPVNDIGDLAGWAAASLNKFASQQHENLFAKAGLAVMRICFFPFQRTPFNILRKGVRYTLNPVSLFDIGLGIVQNSRATAADGTTQWKWNAKGRNPELIERLGQQLQGAILMMLLAATGAGEGDDDDQNKPFVITGSAPFTPQGRAEREAQMRSGIGPYRISFRQKDGSERFGFNYGRIEPMATTLAASIDLMKSVKRANRSGKGTYDAASEALGGLASQAQDKSFMKGVSDLVALVTNLTTQPDLQENRKFQQFLAGRVAMVIPNIIKQPIREADGLYRERSNDFMQELLYQVAPFGQKEAKIDPFGREAEKTGTSLGRVFDVTDAGTDEVHPVDAMLLRWRDKHPDKKWFPGPIVSAEYRHPGTGQEVKMTEAQLSEFRQMAGKRADALLKGQNLNMSNPTAADVEKAKNVITQARSEMKKALAYKFSRQ